MRSNLHTPYLSNSTTFIFKWEWPPYVHTFEYLVFSWWNYLERIRRRSCVTWGGALMFQKPTPFPVRAPPPPPCMLCACRWDLSSHVCQVDAMLPAMKGLHSSPLRSQPQQMLPSVSCLHHAAFSQSLKMNKREKCISASLYFTQPYEDGTARKEGLTLEFLCHCHSPVMVATLWLFGLFSWFASICVV